MAASLDARRKQGLLVPLQPAEGAAYNQCHENAEAYVRERWLIEDFSDFTYFNAHNVVRNLSGDLFEPTPMRQHYLFLTHEGDEEDFALQRHNRPCIQYPVVELDWYHLGAPVDDEPFY